MNGGRTKAGRGAIALVLVTALGVAAGEWHGRRHASSSPPATEGPDAEPATATAAGNCEPRGAPAANAAVDMDALTAVVRRAVAEQFEASGRKEPPTEAPDAHGRPPSKLAPTPEAVAALAHGRTVVDTARAQGRWTDDDAEALRSVLPQLDDASRDEVLQSLTKAVNLGELTVETRGRLL